LDVNKKLVLLTALYIGTYFAHAQPQKAATIGFYNLENLFDTVDDPAVDDAEYLPNGKNQWTDERYQQKLANMAQVIAGMSPDVLGVCELENRKVLEDLIRQPIPAAKRYQIVHFDMQDLRGVDVALLYRPAVFKPFAFIQIPVIDPDEPEFKTRNILWVKGLINSHDTLHIAINHWPSRRGGGGKETKRLLAAEALRKTFDSVLTINPKANIIALGDFNDDPNNRSIKKILTPPSAKNPAQLYNAAEPTFKKGYGTLAFNGMWNLFDQMILSPALIDNTGTEYEPNSFTIFAPLQMRESTGKDKGAPKRTFRGDVYEPTGYSDHFPVFLIVRTGLMD